MMKRILMTGLAIFALSACTTYGNQESAGASEAAPTSEADPCGATSLQDYIGKPGNAANQAALEAAAPAQFRWIPEGTPVTMDYRLTRLNVELDANDVIKRIACY